MRGDAAAAQVGWDDETTESAPARNNRMQLQEALLAKIPAEHLQVLLRAYEAGALRLSIVRWEKHDSCQGMGCGLCSGGEYGSAEFLPLRSTSGGAR